MKYLHNYQPYYWNHAENSTQNSSSNLRYILFHVEVFVSNGQKRLNINAKLLYTHPFLVRDCRLVNSRLKKKDIINSFLGRFLAKCIR